jgi:hypothetical protein
MEVVNARTAKQSCVREPASRFYEGMFCSSSCLDRTAISDVRSRFDHSNWDANDAPLERCLFESKVKFGMSRVALSISLVAPVLFLGRGPFFMRHQGILAK